MGEKLYDVLLRLGPILHWLGKYEEANAAILCGRLLRVKEITSIEELQKFVDKEENGVNTATRFG